MGSIKCLNCRNEITTISGMECPHCKAQLSHVKIAFLSYLGTEDSLAGYQRSYKLVLLKCIFTALLDVMPPVVQNDKDRQILPVSVQMVTEAFRDYYLTRVKEGLPTDKDVDSRIENIDNSSLRDVWLMIQMNPLAAIQKQGFLRVAGEGLNGEFVLQKELNSFTAKELRNLIDLLDRKLELYYKKINSRAVSWVYKFPAQAAEAITEKEMVVSSGTSETPEVIGAVEPCQKDVASECTDGQPDEVPPAAAELTESNVPIEELSLSTRAFNALKRGKIDTLGQLAKAFSDGSLAEIRNIGKIVIEEIAEVLNNPAPKTHEEDFSYDGEFSAELASGIADKRIDEVFEGGMFNLFVQHCRLTGKNQVKDLAGFKYEELLTIRGLGAKKVSAVLERLKEIEQLATNGAGADSVSNEALGALIQEKKIYIHPTNRGCAVSILRLAGITGMAITALSEAEYTTLGDLDGIDYQVFTRKVRHRSTEAMLKALDRFENPF